MKDLNIPTAQSDNKTEYKNGEPLARDVNNQLSKKYPTLKVKYDGNMMGGIYVFTIKGLGLIPADDISSEPGTSLAIEKLTKGDLMKEIEILLNKYKKG